MICALGRLGSLRGLIADMLCECKRTIWLSPRRRKCLPYLLDNIFGTTIKFMLKLAMSRMARCILFAHFVGVVTREMGNQEQMPVRWSTITLLQTLLMAAPTRHLIVITIAFQLTPLDFTSIISDRILRYVLTSTLIRNCLGLQDIALF